MGRRRLPWKHPHLKKPQSTASEPDGQDRKLVLRDQPDIAASMPLGSKRPSRGRRLLQNRPPSPPTVLAAAPDATTPQRHLAQPPVTPSRSTQRLKGLFANDTWLCDCQPRKEAKRLTVSKRGRNKGRQFWTCDSRSCDFFLWDEEAITRTRGVTVSTPSEVTVTTTPASMRHHQDTKPPSPLTQAQVTELPTPSTSTRKTYTSETAASAKKKSSICDFFPRTPGTDDAGTSILQQGTSTLARGLRLSPGAPVTGAKRKRVQFDEDNEDLIGDLSSDEERQLTEAIERSSRKLRSGGPGGESTSEPATGHAQASPADKVKSEPQQLPTARTLFRDAASTRSGGAREDGNENKRLRGEVGPGVEPHILSRTLSPDTPLHQSGQGGPPPQETGNGLGLESSVVDEPNCSVTREVMTMLEGHAIDPSVVSSIQQALERQTARTRGAIRGRDVVRHQLKAKDERIAQLQEKNAALENKCKMQREQITNFKASLAELYAQH